VKIQAIPAAWERRRQAVRGQQLEAFRLVNAAGDALPGLVLDYYQGRYLVTIESPEWLERRAAVEASLEVLQKKIDPECAPTFHWVGNFPGRRGKLPGANPEQFSILEDSASFEVHLGEGPHSGLFLDQRENRREVQKIASHRRCLNLFCHTGAFTVAALRGGADQTVSVDLSKNYLAWLRRNLELNQISQNRSRELNSDVQSYLAKARRAQERFDLILLDPPTFGRSKTQAFSTLRDYGRLLEDCLELLSPTGRLLACLNTRKVSPKEFRDFLKNSLRGRNRKILSQPKPPVDFPELRDSQFPQGLKNFWLG